MRYHYSYLSVTVKNSEIGRLSNVFKLIVAEQEFETMQPSGHALNYYAIYSFPNRPYLLCSCKCFTCTNSFVS